MTNLKNGKLEAKPRRSEMRQVNAFNQFNPTNLFNFKQYWLAPLLFMKRLEQVWITTDLYYLIINKIMNQLTCFFFLLLQLAQVHEESNLSSSIWVISKTVLPLFLFSGKKPTLEFLQSFWVVILATLLSVL